jgi:hypothetical protein
MLFKEMIDVYSEKQAKLINKNIALTDCLDSWYI